MVLYALLKTVPLLFPLSVPFFTLPPSPYKRDPAKDLKSSSDSKELKDYRDCCHFTPGCDFEISNNKAEFREIIVLLLFAAIFLWVLLSHGPISSKPSWFVATRLQRKSSTTPSPLTPFVKRCLHAKAVTEKLNSVQLNALDCELSNFAQNVEKQEEIFFPLVVKLDE